jgi:spore coat polysaccharide biosynthesis protein SpsF
MNKRVIAIIQARMSSTRLPGKVLLDLGGQPVLERMVERVKRSKLVSETVVATTTDASDDPIVELCTRLETPVFRGSLPDVLDRYYQCARQFGADIIVRLTGDCPLVDPVLIDQVIDELLKQGADFSRNRLPPPYTRSYPIGLDVEACTVTALETAWLAATEKHDREHVMPYLYEVPGRFEVTQVQNDVDYGTLRWTLDTSEDMALLREVIQRLGGRNDFTWVEVLELFLEDPELAKINRSVKHKSMFDVEKTVPGGSK